MAKPVLAHNASVSAVSRQQRGSNADSRAYWLSHKTEYPHHAVSDVGNPSPPELVILEKEAFQFLACPFDGLCHWGFKAEADLKLFLRQFPQAARLG